MIPRPRRYAIIERYDRQFGWEEVWRGPDDLIEDQPHRHLVALQAEKSWIPYRLRWIEKVKKL